MAAATLPERGATPAAQGRWLEQERPYADLKILGLTSYIGDDPCNFYRLLSPLNTLVCGGAHVEINGPRGLTAAEAARFDVILCLREVRSREVAEDLAQAVRAAGKVLLVASDDDLLWFSDVARHGNTCAAQEPEANPEWKRGLLRLLRASDGFLGSTPELVRAYSAHVRRAWWVENSLDFDYHPWNAPWPRRRSLAGKLMIGGTRAVDHYPYDFEPLRGALGRLARRYPHVQFAFVGELAGRDAAEGMRQFCERHDLPPERVTWLDRVPFRRFPELVAQLDIGLASLEENPGNRAKSRLRLLDYGARAIPYAASPRAAYRRYHQDSGGACGALCDTPEEWFTVLCRLVEDAPHRRQLGQAGAAYVRSECGIAANAWRWAEVFREARALGPPSGRGSLSLPAGRPGRNDPCPCGSGIKRKRCCREAFG